MIKKCVDCDSTTNLPLIELAGNDWAAYSIGRGKSRCYCPKHKHHISYDMTKELTSGKP